MTQKDLSDKVSQHSPDSWFTEFFTSEVSSFGLQIKSLLHEEKSPYQCIQIYDTTHFGKLMVLDGCVMLTQRDNFLYHEMMSHPTLLSHTKPEKVVIIGGGDCGTLKEVLKHDCVESVVQIELDERVTEVSKKYFPELCEANTDPRATLLFQDGIEWIKNCQENSIDVLIIDSTDPVGPAAGLVSKPFYRDCFKALSDGGILVQQSESPLYHANTIIADMKKDLELSGFKDTLLRTFPQPVYPSGWWSCLAAFVNVDADTGKVKRAKEFSTQYYNDAIHEASACLPEFMP